MLDEAAIQSAVGSAWVVRVVAEVDSTNTVLKERDIGEVPQALFAEHQRAGRGRRENVWIGSPGKDLLMSVALRPAADFSNWARATSAAAVALCETIEAETPLKPQIKWPNDVLISGRKVAGLLAETSRPGGHPQLVLGIGLNVNGEMLPGMIAGTAISLKMALGREAARPLDREALAVTLLRRLALRLGELEDGFPVILAFLRSRSCLFGKQIRARVMGEWVFGRVIDLDREGGLVLELPDGHRSTLVSAEEVRPA